VLGRCPRVGRLTPVVTLGLDEWPPLHTSEYRTRLIGLLALPFVGSGIITKIKIAVLSNTHVTLIEDLPEKVINSLSEIDLVIHAGDFTTTEVLNGLKQLGKIKAVHGNMDSAELQATLPAKEIIGIGNKRIGIIHGGGAPWGIEKRLRNAFAQDRVDVIIYGHSHESQNKVTDGILFFNPGKASNSFGIITIEEDIEGEIISSKK